MKLITEHTNEIEYLTEGKGKEQYIKGIFMQSDIKNQNGRVYPHAVLQKEVKNFNTKYVNEGRALGELDHPDSSVVNLNNVSHNVLEMHWKGKDLVGTVEVLGTPAGNILKELFKSGIKLGISSRGLGSVESISEDGGEEVQDDFELIAFDFVSNSSSGLFVMISPLAEEFLKCLLLPIRCINFDTWRGEP